MAFAGALNLLTTQTKKPHAHHGCDTPGRASLALWRHGSRRTQDYAFGILHQVALPRSDMAERPTGAARDTPRPGSAESERLRASKATSACSTGPYATGKTCSGSKGAGSDADNMSLVRQCGKRGRAGLPIVQQDVDAHAVSYQEVPSVTLSVYPLLFATVTTSLCRASLSTGPSLERGL
jgi:hypothetical protein